MRVPARGRAGGGSPAASVWDIRERLQENFQRVESLLREMERDGDARIRLAAAAELRHHLELAQKTLEAAARAEAVRDFQDAVLEMLEEAGVAARARVLARLERGQMG